MRTVALPASLLTIFLAALSAFTLILQVMSVPGQFLSGSATQGEQAHLAWTLFALAELELLVLQAVILCTWRLLTMVRKDRIFSTASLPWVDGIVWAFVVGWVALAGVAAYLIAVIYVTPELRDPGVPIVLIGLVLFGSVLVLLVVVLRALLRQATALRTDMDGVI
jgi:hypothetical protein